METGMQIDRQATWQEVCDALALASLHASAVDGTEPEESHPAPNPADHIGTFAEELAWIELARQAHNPASH